MYLCKRGQTLRRFFNFFRAVGALRKVQDRKEARAPGLGNAPANGRALHAKGGLKPGVNGCPGSGSRWGRLLAQLDEAIGHEITDGIKPAGNIGDDVIQAG